MDCRKLKVWLPLLLAVALAGCAGITGLSQPLTYTPASFETGKYTAKAENFQIIVDASMTMGNQGQAGLQTSKNLVAAINQSLPADFTANAGLRTFGHSDSQSKKPTELVYGMTQYSQAGMQAGLDKIRFGGGNSPLGAAITAAAADLEKTTGSAALVIVSDGIQNNMDDAVTAAQKAKAAMGDRLCIYTVQVGTDAAGTKVLEKVAAAGGCGSAENAAALTDAGALGAFVQKVFLTLKPAPAPVAAPAPAPEPAPVPAPAPAPVVKEIITFNLLFDFDKATIRDDMVPMLEQAQKILNEDPAATYVIAGHTCSIGTDAYNQKLSERRAAAVKNWLVGNGIAAGRLETVGFGETQPKYDNKTNEGRTLNRRVEIQSK
jgi:OOP family OmpA-OmpF porin